MYAIKQLRILEMVAEELLQQRVNLGFQKSDAPVQFLQILIRFSLEVTECQHLSFVIPEITKKKIK